MMPAHEALVACGASIGQSRSHPEFVQSWSGVIVGFCFVSVLALPTKLINVEHGLPEPGPQAPTAPVTPASGG